MPDRDLSNDVRPSPEALIKAAQEEEHRRGGRLKVFLGAAPGVGKTYTMLEAARARAMQGQDVAIGIVETHGRSETAELMLGLDIIPRIRVEYRGTMLEEMDLDAILARRPALVLVDELAHTNAPGSRHPKRYLDVEELLDAGMDVYTTVNIQHLESLNDAVAQITGIRVRETVPDRIMQRADEIELVDLSVEELQGRLREGKIYVPEQAERAVRSYFRAGNLNALRQLALRHLAERVDVQMQTYMQAHAIPGPWPVGRRLVVSVGPSPLSPRLVRATRRRAERLRAEWIAVYVETPQHYRLAEADRDRVAQTLRLVEELGGEAVTIPGQKVAEDVVRFARSRNASEIVVGKSHRSRWFALLHGSIVNDLIRRSGEIDVYVIAGTEEEAPGEHLPETTERSERPFDKYLWAGGMVGLAALAAFILRAHLALPNLSMVFLMAVLTSAVFWGLRASIFASILSVMVYDFFLVEPYHTFTISSPQDVLALVTFLVVAILTSNLTGRVRDQARSARRREARTAALYDLSRDIAAAQGLDDVVQGVVHRVGHIMRAQVMVLLPESELLRVRASHPPAMELTESELAAATWTWRHNREAGRGTGTLSGEKWFYIPLRTSERTLGVLALCFDTPDAVIEPDQRRLLTALADQSAVAIERAIFARDIEQARLLGERERLQAILLSSISHDLRTPLASILGSATTLIENDQRFSSATRRDLLQTIREEAERLNRFVGNLLDTTRLESGALTLNREWIGLDDVIGAALARLTAVLEPHPVELSIAPDLPLLHVDFVLLEQVFVNLLDNAAKYSPSGAPIRVDAMVEGGEVVAMVEDEGDGIPEKDVAKVFDKFYRVQQGDRQKAGTGLGLSICRGIIEEHGGSISVQSPGRSGRGSIFSITLPIEMPPEIPREQE